MHRTLDRVDGFIAARAWPTRSAHRIGRRPCAGRVAIAGLPRDHDRAVGHRFIRRYPWLPAAALDPLGEIRHPNGIGALPGLYVLGLRFQRHRSSNFIGGVGRDARFVVDHLAARSARSRRRRHDCPRTHAPSTSSSSAVASPARPRPCCWPGAGGGCSCSSGPLAGRDGLDPRADEGWRAPAAPVGSARGGPRAGTPAIRQATFHFGDESLVLPVKPTGGIDSLVAPRRTLLDPLLADAAVAAGADVRYGTTCTGLVRDEDGRVAGVTARDADGWPVEAHALARHRRRRVRSIVARSVGAE